MNELERKVRSKAYKISELLAKLDPEIMASAALYQSEINSDTPNSSFFSPGDSDKQKLDSEEIFWSAFDAWDAWDDRD